MVGCRLLGLEKEQDVCADGFWEYVCMRWHTGHAYMLTHICVDILHKCVEYFEKNKSK